MNSAIVVLQPNGTLLLSVCKFNVKIAHLLVEDGLWEKKESTETQDTSGFRIRNRRRTSTMANN